MRNHFSSIIFLIILFPMIFVSCAKQQPAGLAKLSDGTTVTWTPAEPRIGDLVTLTAETPAGSTLDAAYVQNAEYAAGSQKTPYVPITAFITARNLRAAPVCTEYTNDKTITRFSFRIDRTGAWNIEITPAETQADSAHTAEPAEAGIRVPAVTRLWVTESEAGSRTDLVKFDPQYLWSGKGDAKELSAAGQTAAGNHAPFPQAAQTGRPPAANQAGRAASSSGGSSK